MAKSSRKDIPNYYGGDNIDENDEEAVRLYLSDIRRRQTLLYPSFQLNNAPIGLVMQPLSKGELLAVSGQSRFFLYLHRISEHRRLKCTQKVASHLFDFVLFKNKVKLREFPQNLSEEAERYRAHGLPLLLWPSSKDKLSTQTFLDQYYPDCGFYFRELDKVLSWLSQKWEPLANGIGISSSGENLNKENPTKPWISDFKMDSTAACYIKHRLLWCHRYSKLIKDYLVCRLEETPAFHFNRIHSQLFELASERAACLQGDNAFLSACGESLLQIILEAQSAECPIAFSTEQIANRLSHNKSDSKRRQCLSLLMPMQSLTLAVAKRKEKKCLASSDKRLRLDKNASDHPQADLTTAASVDDESCIDVGSDDDADRDGGEMEVQEMSTGDSFPTEGGFVKKFGTENRPMSRMMFENRGLVKYRHKRERNPRVHLRYKYKKATIRYRSRIPPVRKEDKPYSGEARGIRANLIRSQKFSKH